MVTPEEERAMLALVASLQQEPPVHLELSALDVYFLITQLQLAQRHPANTGPVSRRMHQLAKQMEERLAPVGSPLHNIMEMGWNPEHDVPKDQRR